MKLWLFLFASDSYKLVSARVAAPNRVVACAVMGSVLEMRLDPNSPQPADNVILQFFGKINLTEPIVVSAILRNGTTYTSQGLQS